ncbi:MAG: MFS transporter, partial [Solirubrobacterales bacterium]|nr:MFS transporter [Solirubrobacterales bacterium]
MSDSRTAGLNLPASRRWATLVVLSLTLFISAVDLLIVNAALEEIAVDLKTSLADLAWVVSGFTLAIGSWPLAAGALGERIGRKPLILTGLAIFGLSSLFAAMAETTTTLIAARYAMGLGIGIVMPNAVGTIRGMFSGSELHKALAIWAAAAGLGVVTGPLAGGLLLRHFDWGSIFLVNVPFVAIALIAGAVLIPETRTPGGRRLDVVGIVLAVPAITSLVWGIIEAPERGWTNTTIVVAFAAFALLSAAWVAWELRTGEPMVELAWFR